MIQEVKEDKQIVRLFQPAKVLALMENIERTRNQYQVSVWDMIQNWTSLKATLQFYYIATKDEIKEFEVKQSGADKH